MYQKPLLALLEGIIERKHFDTDRNAFYRVLFQKLKDFYDPKDKLSDDDAMDDMSLRRKFRDLLLFFYNIKDPGSFP